MIKRTHFDKILDTMIVETTGTMIPTGSSRAGRIRSHPRLTATLSNNMAHHSLHMAGNSSRLNQDIAVSIVHHSLEDEIIVRARMSIYASRLTAIAGGNDLEMGPINGVSKPMSGTEILENVKTIRQVYDQHHSVVLMQVSLRQSTNNWLRKRPGSRRITRLWLTV